MSSLFNIGHFFDVQASSFLMAFGLQHVGVPQHGPLPQQSWMTTPCLLVSVFGVCEESSSGGFCFVESDESLSAVAGATKNIISAQMDSVRTDLFIFNLSVPGRGEMAESLLGVTLCFVRWP